MDEPKRGDPRRPDGDLVAPVKPADRRTDEPVDEFSPKVGWGHDAVYRPPTPDQVAEDDPESNLPSGATACERLH